MALVKYNPVNYSPLGFRSFVDKFFNDDFYGGSSVSNFSPQVDIAETDQAFEIDFHLPGIKKEDIKNNLNNFFLVSSLEHLIYI